MSELFDCGPEATLGASPARGCEPALVSPSLFSTDAGADSATAYEVKFLLTEDQVREITERVTGKLMLDPYADPTLANAYHTTSIYTDTPGFDVFHRTEGYARDKFRVRRYGFGGSVFVERKTKKGEKVRKHRSKIDIRDVSTLADSQLNDEWAGEWFHSQLLAKKLRPVCRVSYERVAYLGAIEGGAVRVTFDRNIRGVACEEWNLEVVGSAPALLTDRVVGEFKFRAVMPILLKEIVADLNLAPAPFSKYRNFLQSTGAVPDRVASTSLVPHAEEEPVDA